MKWGNTTIILCLGPSPQAWGIGKSYHQNQEKAMPKKNNPVGRPPGIPNPGTGRPPQAGKGGPKRWVLPCRGRADLVDRLLSIALDRDQKPGQTLDEALEFWLFRQPPTLCSLCGSSRPAGTYECDTCERVHAADLLAERGGF